MAACRAPGGHGEWKEQSGEAGRQPRGPWCRSSVGLPCGCRVVTAVWLWLEALEQSG